MNQHVKKILLCTVTACPMGRSMQTVIKEVCSQVQGLSYDIVYAELQPDITNRYLVHKNPTTLFLNGQEEEQYRVEGFVETLELLSILQKVEAGTLKTEQKPEVVLGTNEEYTVYLFKGGSLAPVQIIYPNPTSVKTPRITAIRMLLQARVEGMENPFPPSAELMQLKFVDNNAEILVRVNPSDLLGDQENMRLALVHTLAHFNIKDVVLQFVHNLK